MGPEVPLKIDMLSLQVPARTYSNLGLITLVYTLDPDDPSMSALCDRRRHFALAVTPDSSIPLEIQGFFTQQVYLRHLTEPAVQTKLYLQIQCTLAEPYTLSSAKWVNVVFFEQPPTFGQLFPD